MAHMTNKPEAEENGGQDPDNPAMAPGFWVWFRVWGLGFGVWGLGFGVGD